MSALVLATRLQYKVTQVFPEAVAIVSTIGDSTCVISAMEKNAMSFNPFMHACISESCTLRDTMSKSCLVEEIQHMESKQNIADICTRMDAKLVDIGPSSLWQEGPAWLKHPRHSWSHCSWDFCCKSFPEEETKHLIHIFLPKSCPKDF